MKHINVCEKFNFLLRKIKSSLNKKEKNNTLRLHIFYLKKFQIMLHNKFKKKYHNYIIRLIQNCRNSIKCKLNILVSLLS